MGKNNFMDKDMSFLRDFFRIPENVQTCWVLIHDEELPPRLGLELVGLKKVIDVPDGCFHQVYEWMQLKPVSHRTNKNGEEFFASDDESLILAPDYVRKLYFRRVYSKELMATPLL